MTVYKLVCFDLDETLVDGTDYIYNTLHINLKTDAVKRNATADKFFSNKITYKEWFEHDRELWKAVGAKKSDMLNAIKDVNLHEGAKETLTELKRHGIKIALISGSIDLVLEKAFGDYNDFFDYVFINKVFLIKKVTSLVGSTLLLIWTTRQPGLR